MTGKRAHDPISPDKAGIARAAQILRENGLIAVPTETVYGLAARADKAEAVARIYATKGRPDFNPLIVHVRDRDQAEMLGVFDERARSLADKFWPGPLTLVLPVKASAPIAKAVTAGLPTIALRQPAHPVMQQVLNAVGLPLAAPSANRSEHISPTRADHVMASLVEACPPVIDGGPSQSGLESTIVALREGGDWSLLRPGPIAIEQIEALLGLAKSAQTDKIEAPGQMTRHYSPGKPMRLCARKVAQDEFLIGFGPAAGDCNLSEARDLNEAAARLYECLHRAAASDRPRIAVAPVPDNGVGQAINDRLRRAAAL